MSHKIAVIDLGTNTFHLLIVEITGSAQWNPVYRERIYVNLAFDSIDWISEPTMDRGLSAMQHFRDCIDTYDVKEITAVGTAALRRARNARVFLERVAGTTGIVVDVIPGLREAQLIAKGVLSALPKIDRPALIMDIGGGSVEMILTRGDEILFAESYPVGVAVLHAKFHLEEPIGDASIGALDRHLEETFSDLLVQLQGFPDAVLVGASGTFEVVEAILEPHKVPDIPPYSTAKPQHFRPIYEEIVALDFEARLAHPDIPESRARYIVVAVHLIQFMLKTMSEDIFYISAYAMKEGIVVEKARM